MTAPSLNSLKDQYGFVADDDLAGYGFVPDGATRQDPELESLFAEDKNLTIGIPKGADLDQVNLQALTGIYQKPKEEFFFGIPDKLQDAGQGAMLDVIMKVKDLAGGNLRMAADAMDTPVTNEELFAFLNPLDPMARQDLVLHSFGRGIKKVTDFISGIDDWATDVYMGGQRTAGSSDFSIDPSRAMRKTADRLQDWSNSMIEQFKLKPDTDSPYNEEMISPEKPVDPFAEDLAFGLGQGGMSILTSLGLAYATKRPEIVASLFGLQMTGGKYQEYIDRGMDEKKARQLAVLAGVGEGGLEYIGLDSWMKAIRGSQQIRRWAIRTGSEVMQEMSQQGSEIFVDALAGIERTGDQVFYEIGMAGLTAAILGGSAASIQAAFEQGSYFSQLRERYNMTDEQTEGVMKTIMDRTQARMPEVKQHMAKKLNEELADAEIRLAEGQKGVRVEVPDETQRFNKAVADLEELRTVALELEALGEDTGQIGDQGQVDRYREDLQKEIARLESVVGVKEEARFSRRNQPIFDKFFEVVKGRYGSANTIEENGVKVQISPDVIDQTGLKVFQRTRGADDNVVYIDTIESANPGKGKASAILKELTHFADQTGAELRLVPRIFKRGTMKLQELKDWYARNGFVQTPEGYMIRKPSSVRFSRQGQSSLGFYSAAIRAIEDKMPASASREQVMGILKNTPGVKAAEVESMDLYSFPEEGDMNAPLQKDQLLAWMQQNMVTIEEEILGGEDTKKKVKYLEGDQVPKKIQVLMDMVDDGELNLSEFADKLHEMGYVAEIDQSGELAGIYKKGAKPTRFEQYKMPGVKKYQERVITIPFRAITKLPKGFSVRATDTSKQADAIEMGEPVYQVDLPASGWTDFKTKEEAEAAGGGISSVQRTVYYATVKRDKNYRAKQTEGYESSGGTKYKVIVKAGAYASGQHNIRITGDAQEYTELTATRKTPKKALQDYIFGEYSKWELVYPDGTTSIIRGDLSEQEAINESIDRLLTDEQRANQRGFSSSHWPNHKNVAVHERGGTFMIGDKKVYVVDELQSDWIQEGRKHGFVGEKSRKAKLKSNIEVRRLTEQDLEYMDDDAQVGDWGFFDVNQVDVPLVPFKVDGGQTEQQAVDELYELAKDASVDTSDFFSEGKSGQIPNNPLKDVIFDVAIKRVIRWAVENGYDAVAFAPGSIHFERWGTQEIAWVKGENEDVWRVSGTEQRAGQAGGMDLEGEARARGILQEANGEYVTSKEGLRKIVARIMSRESSEDQIAKLTDRVWARMQSEEAGTSTPRKEGFEYFYDKMVPTMVQKAVKAVTGGKESGKMEEVSLEQESAEPKIKAALNDLANSDDEVIAEAAQRMLGSMTDELAPWSVVYQREIEFGVREGAERIKKMLEGTGLLQEKSAIKVKMLPLTTQIRQSVMEGQALFSRGAGGSSTVELVEAQIRSISKGMGNLPEILVFQTAEEAANQVPMSPQTRADILAEGDGAVEAAFIPRAGGRDQLVMIADRLAPNRISFVFYHELVGHYGLRMLYGPKFHDAMKTIYEKNQKIRTRAKAIMDKFAQYDQATATEEAMSDTAAEMAQEKEYPDWWQKFLGDIFRTLRRLGLDIEMTDAELNAIIADARRMVEKQPNTTAADVKLILDTYAAAAHEAKQAKQELEYLQPIIDFFRENKVVPTKGLEEDFRWKEIPRVFKAGKDERGQTLDHFVAKTGDDQPLNEGGDLIQKDTKIPKFQSEDEVADFMIASWSAYKAARSAARLPALPRLRQKPTLSAREWLKRRESVVLARQAGKKAGLKQASDALSYQMLRQDMKRTVSEEGLQARIAELKDRVRQVKARTLEEREAARQEYAAKLADEKRAILWKIQKKEAVGKSIEQFIMTHLPVQERGRLLKVARAAGTGEKAIAQAFDRVQRSVDAYIRRQTIERIKKVAEAAQAKSVAVDYREAVERIIEDLDFQKPTAKTRARLQKLKEYIEKKRLAGEDPGVGLDEYEALRRLEKVSVAELTQLDLLRILDRVALLVRVGQTKRALLKNRWDTDKSVAIEILRAEARNMGRLGSKPPMIKTKLPFGKITSNTWEDIRAELRKWDWSLLPMDAFIDMLDGYKDYHGANYRIFKNRIDLSFQHYLDLRDRVTKPLKELGKKLKLDEEAYYRIGVFATDEQEGGRQKLLAYAESEEEVPFIEKMIEEIKSEMTPAEMEWYAEARQTLDALKPQIAEVMRRVYNKPFAEVKNYFPFMMNFEAMSDTEIENRFGDSVEMYGAKPKQDVAKGFTEERVGGRFKNILNAMDVVTNHLDNASYLVEMGESVKFLQQIASSNEYQKIVGQDAQDYMTRWLSLVAKKGNQKREKGLDAFRNMAGVYALGFRLSTGLIQTTAILDGASYIGHYAATGMAKLADDKWRKFVLANLPELRDRIGDDPTMADLSYVAAEQNWKDVLKNYQAKATKLGYTHIKFMDALVAQAVAGGAYMKYMEDNKLQIDTETANPDAVRYAQLVLRRTQASAFAKDLPAAVSRGSLTGDSASWGKLLFQFQTFMLNRWSMYRNDILAAGIKGKRPEAIGKLLALLIAAYLEVMLRRGMKITQEGFIDGVKEAMGYVVLDDNNDDDDSILEEFFSSIFKSVPVVGSGWDAVKYGSFPVPAVEILSTPFETASAAMRSKQPERRNKHLTRLAAQAAGTLFGGGGQADQILKQVFSDEGVYKR